MQPLQGRCFDSVCLALYVYPILAQLKDIVSYAKFESSYPAIIITLYHRQETIKSRGRIRNGINRDRRYAKFETSHPAIMNQIYHMQKRTINYDSKQN
jgi:hypothetical protein